MHNWIEIKIASKYVWAVLKCSKYNVLAYNDEDNNTIYLMTNNKKFLIINSFSRSTENDATCEDIIIKNIIE